MMTHDELVHCIQHQHPQAKHCVDFFVGMPIDVTTGAQTKQAFVMQWDLPGEAPTEEVVNSYEQTYASLIADFRASRAASERCPNLTSRQFWLAAASIGITKPQSVEKVSALADDEIDRLWMITEIQEATSFERQHPAVVTLSEALEIPSEQLDHLWAWASNL